MRRSGEIDTLVAQLAIKKSEIAKARAQVELAEAIVATNKRLNERRPGMVSGEELRKSAAEVKIATAMVQLAQAELQELELRLDQAKRGISQPRRPADAFDPESAARSSDSMERRLTVIEGKLDQVLKELGTIKEERSSKIRR